MPPIIPDEVPDHFPAGTTVKFTRTLDDYLPSDGWAYTIYLNGLTQKFNKTATPPDDGSDAFQIEFVPTDTASLNPGPYRYAERLTNSTTGEVYDLRGDELVINIEPNVASSPAGTFNTWAKYFGQTRDDMERSECSVNQLKLKADEAEPRDS